jgi:DNA-binding PadR family transcriptional regulator
MSLIHSRGGSAMPLANERRRVLEALGDEAMTGPAVFRRMRERSIGDATGVGDGVQAGDQAFLYPALHSLEADRRLQATWLPDAGGGSRRAYRRRRPLPSLPCAMRRS